jgi:hypothetical protein
MSFALLCALLMLRSLGTEDKVYSAVVQRIMNYNKESLITLLQFHILLHLKSEAIYSVFENNGNAVSVEFKISVILQQFIIIVVVVVVVVAIIIIILGTSHCLVFVPLINTVLLLGAPMLPMWWVKISTYLQLEQFLSVIFISNYLKLLIIFVHNLNVLC